MILTDREIKLSLDRGLIVIDPRPGERAFSSTSVDLTLDKNINIFKLPTGGIQKRLDPTDPGFDHDEVIEEITQKSSIDGGFDLKPHSMILAWTAEYIDLRGYAQIAARVEGKSSLARLGLAIHVTAPTIHAGFNGQIRLEVINHGHLPIILRPGMRVCQLIFEQTVGTPDSGYQGQFSGQKATLAD